MVCVLVVEDEATLLKNVARSLRLAGFEVLTAETCELARSAFKNNRVDGLCLDIGLPDGDGLDLLEEIRRNAPDLPAIVISSASTPEARLRAARLGVRQFLPKPFRLADINAALARFVVET
jgi:DNA-binding response OmpR family regulator